MATKKEKIEVSYAHGFLVARVADVDTSEGMEETTAGVDVRIRCSKILMYRAAEPGVVLVAIDGIAEENENASIAIVGTVKGMDDAMKRDRIKET